MSFLLGFAAAIGFLSLQAPAAGPGLEFAGTFAWRTALHQTVGITLAAFLASGAPRKATDRSGGHLLAGLATGAAVQALLLGWRLPLPAAQVPLAACAALMACGAVFLLVLRRRNEPDDAPRGAGLLALALAGAGAGLCLQGVGRIALRLGLGSPLESDWLFAVGLTGAAAGGLAFGRFLAGFERDRARGATAALALAGTGLGAWLATRAALLVVSPRGLRTLVKRFHHDVSDAGTLAFGALTGLTLLIVPAFFAGTALYSARGRRALTTVGLGAAFAPLASNLLLSRGGPADLLAGSGGSTTLVVFGGWACVAAAALMLLPGSGARAGGRAWGLLTGAATAAALLLASAPAIPVLRSWQRFPVDPITILEVPVGQILIEPADGGLRAVLDQIPLTNGPAGLPFEKAQIEGAFDRVDPRILTQGTRVLLIGQLDPQRADWLVRNSAKRIDRTASWWTVMGRIEQELGLSDGRVPGSVLSPEAAGQAWASGAYDLVIALARPQLAPRNAASPGIAHPDTRTVLWLDGSAPIAALDLGGQLLMTTTGLADFALAPIDAESGVFRGRQDTLLAGKPAGHLAPAVELLRREWERPAPRRARNLERLARWNPPYADWLSNLGRLAASQRLASPFESYAQSLVLDRQLIRDMAVQAVPLKDQVWARRTMEGVARVLVDRRDIGQLVETIEPLSIAWNRPAGLEISLAQGDLESLQPQAAIQRLEPLAAAAAASPTALRLLGEAHYQLGDYPKSVAAWQALKASAGLDEFHTRRLALALLRSGDPQGTYQVKLLLALHPEDEELQAALEAGPVAPNAPSFEPQGEGHDH